MADTAHVSSAAGEVTAARLRHQHEVDAINEQVAHFVHQYTQHIQHALLTLTPGTQPSATSPAVSPPQHSLDDILPPPPQPKRKHTHAQSHRNTALPSSPLTATPTATTDDSSSSREDDDEVERDAYGVLIKRRRSKLPLRSVLELRAWFADHLHAPYPTDAQRDELARRTQLSIKQVQNCQTKAP